MTAFLARHLPRLRHNMRCIEIELVASHMLANLSRREADLLIRDEVPDVASIVTRKLGRAAYAVYGNAELARGRRCRITLLPRRQRTCSAAHRCAAGEGRGRPVAAGAPRPAQPAARARRNGSRDRAFPGGTRRPDRKRGGEGTSGG